LSLLGFLVAGAIGVVLLLGALYVIGTVFDPDCNPDVCPEQWED
jgi:hypothetical protein